MFNSPLASAYTLAHSIHEPAYSHSVLFSPLDPSMPSFFITNVYVRNTPTPRSLLSPALTPNKSRINSIICLASTPRAKVSIMGGDFNFVWSPSVDSTATSPPYNLEVLSAMTNFLSDRSMEEVYQPLHTHLSRNSVNPSKSIPLASITFTSVPLTQSAPFFPLNLVLPRSLLILLPPSLTYILLTTSP